ncbi:MAG: replication protein RepA [Rhodothermales bacterium]
MVPIDITNVLYFHCTCTSLSILQRTMSQVSLFEKALVVKAKPAAEAGQLGFGSNLLIQATLPHSHVEDEFFTRRNGDLSLTVRGGAIHLASGSQKLPIPYGSYPRLVLAYLITEAVKTKRRHIDLGSSMRKFMAEIGLTHGGKTAQRLKEQMLALFNCHITAHYQDDTIYAWKDIRIVEEGALDLRDDGTLAWTGEVVLDEKFYKGIVDRPVPLDLRVLKALRRSPLAIDLYSWLTYRVSYTSHPIEVSWAQLQEQLGGDYASVKDFRAHALKELRKIWQFWPEMKISKPSGRLRIGRMDPHVAIKAKA